MIDYISGRVVIAYKSPTVYLDGKKKKFDFKEQKRDILIFDKKHGTQCVKSLDQFNKKYCNYLSPSILSYATQMYFLSTEKKPQSLYGKILLMSERKEIIQNVVGGIKNNQFRNDLQSIFLDISFLMPTADLQLGFTRIMENLLWDYTWDTRGANFDYLPHTPIAGDKKKSAKYSLLNTNMCLDLEKEIQARDKMLVEFVKKHNLNVGVPEISQIVKACKRLNYDQLENLLGKDVSYIRDFAAASKFLSGVMKNLSSDLQSIITYNDYLKTFFQILKYGLLYAPYLTRKMLEKKTSDYMERSAKLLNLAVFASKNTLYFGKAAQTTTKTVNQKNQFRKLRSKQLLMSAKKFTKLNKIKEISEKYEGESTLEDIKKKENKPKKKNISKNQQVQNYRKYRVYANAVLTNRILKKKPENKQKNDEELKAKEPEVSNENNKQLKSNKPKPQPKMEMSVDNGSIVIFRNFALNKTKGFINQCKNCSKTYNVKNDEESNLKNIINKSNDLLKLLNQVDSTNIIKINDIFESLKRDTNTTCLKIAKQHQAEIRQKNLLDYQNKQFRSFCKGVLKQMGSEKLEEARNRGGRVYVKGVPDIWERCYEKFHNRPFIYPGKLRFLDGTRYLGPDETLAYYVTQSSGTDGASFCISVHRWKRMVLVGDEDEVKNDNPESNAASSDKDYSNTDTSINFHPLAKLNPLEWRDLDRLLENSFVVLHVMVQ